MEIEHSANITSSELAMLWSTYLSDSMAICIFEHFLSTVEDKNIPVVIQLAVDYSKEHIEKIKELYKIEKLPIPHAFQPDDVNKDAPRLFSDEFYLRYIRQMGRTGMATFSLATGTAVREDVLTLFDKWLKQSANLYKEATNLMVKKGIMVRSPSISYPKEVEFVKKQKFLKGFYGEKRSLLATEIAHLGTNIEVNHNVKTLLLGFAQVTKNKKIKAYLLKGHEIASKHSHVFSELLEQNNTSIPGTWDSTISSSTVAPFSDKLMLFQVGALTAASMGDYGAAIGGSMRRDIGLSYARLLSEIALYAEDGAELMIESGWFEKPPQTIDRKKLINQSK